MLEPPTADRSIPTTDGVATAARSRSRPGTLARAPRCTTRPPLPIASDDRLAGLLRRSVAERAIVQGGRGVEWWLPGLDEVATGSTAREATGSTAPEATGSTAPEAELEDEEGPIGNGDTPPQAAAPATPAPPPAAPPSPPPPSPPAAAAPAPVLAIASATVKAAPSGAPSSRKRVGVGEVVVFTATAAGTWAASAGTAAGPASTTFRWTAPATGGSVTITLTSGGTSITDTITVVAPATISMRNVGSHATQIGAGGACMLTKVTFSPTDVCLGAMQWLEVPGPGTGVSGFFTKFSAATLHHNPNVNYALVDDNNVMEAGPNNGPNDHCAWHAIPGPYSDGAFTWDIPNRYLIDGEAATAGRYFTDTHQVFTMNAAGTLTITKAGATT